MEQPNELQLVVKQAGLEENKVQSLLNSFGDSFSKAKKVVEKAKGLEVTSEDQVEKMAEARKIRLELKEIRVNVENTRVELKEQSLREGRAIDGISNVIKALIVPIEEYLEKQEKYAEEQKKLRDEQKYQNRIALLTPYVENIEAFNLREMSNETFEKLLEDSKKAFLAIKEAEKKAEEERLAKEKAEQVENERIRKENEALKKEAEEKEKKLAAEREEQNKKLETERKAKEALEEKIRKEKEDREAKEKAEEEERKKALLAPDKEKLLSLADRMDLVKLPVVESREAGLVIEEVRKRVLSMATYIREEATKL